VNNIIFTGGGNLPTFNGRKISDNRPSRIEIRLKNTEKFN
jgi:hypothetical protein